MNYQIIEDNAGGMYLFFLRDDKVVLGIENIEYCEVGDLPPTYDEARAWDSQLENAQERYDEFHRFDFGWSIVADQDGVYPDYMGSNAKSVFGIDED